MKLTDVSSNVPWPMTHPATWSRGAHIAERSRQRPGAALERACKGFGLGATAGATQKWSRHGSTLLLFNGSLITGENIRKTGENKTAIGYVMVND